MGKEIAGGPDAGIRLARGVGEVLDRGLPVIRDSVQFLESTLGVSVPGELAQALESAESGEMLTVLDLLLFPTREIRTALEPLLRELAPGKEEEAQAITLLCNKPARVKFLFPGAAQPVTLEVPASTLEQFVRRLRLAVSIPPGLDAAVRALPEQDVSYGAGGLLRASGMRWRPSLEDLAVRCITAQGGAPGFLDFFEAVLILLSEIPPERDPEEHLEEKRAWCLHHLDKARRAEQMAAGSNMEMRMAAGLRPAYVDTGRLRGQMALIDRILSRKDC